MLPRDWAYKEFLNSLLMFLLHVALKLPWVSHVVSPPLVGLQPEMKLLARGKMGSPMHSGLPFATSPWS